MVVKMSINQYKEVRPCSHEKKRVGSCGKTSMGTHKVSKPNTSVVWGQKGKSERFRHVDVNPENHSKMGLKTMLVVFEVGNFPKNSWIPKPNPSNQQQHSHLESRG